MSHCLARKKSCLSVGNLATFTIILAISCDRSSLILLEPRGSGLARSPAVHSLQTVFYSHTSTPPHPKGQKGLRKPRKLVFLRYTHLTMLPFPLFYCYTDRRIRTLHSAPGYQLTIGYCSILYLYISLYTLGSMATIPL